MQDDGGSVGQPSATTRCAKCKNHLPAASFSRNQLKRGSGAMCFGCVEVVHNNHQTKTCKAQSSPRPDVLNGQSLGERLPPPPSTENSVGHRLLQRLGWKPGQGLGRS
eukprot:5590691-Prymnesium_polylepis.1